MLRLISGEQRIGQIGQMTSTNRKIPSALEYVDRALELIEQLGGDFEGPQSEALLKEAEHELSLKFPPSYRRFLTRYGCGDVAGLEVYGLLRDDFENSGVPDTVWVTKQQRKIGLPDSLLVVSDSGDGSFFALDADNTSEDHEYAVVRYGVNGLMEVVSESFGKFLLDELLNLNQN